MQTSVSVILCTHNPKRDCLGRVLDALRAQTIPLQQWEFLLIDNASKERLADTWDVSWHPRGRHLREDEIGLTAARLRGIRESRGELLVFVDDDNLLSPDFLEQAERISARYPYLGVFGAGILEAEFEVPPPRELVRHLDMLPLRSVPSVLWTNNPRDVECIPWGAGLCVTRGIADLYPRFIEDLNVTALLDRRGERLFCGGDDMFSWASARAGQGSGLFPELRVTHLILARRLTQRYFVRLMHDQTCSRGILAYLLARIRPRPIDLIRCARLLLHGIKNGQFSMRCYWALLRAEDWAAHFIAENRLTPIESFVSSAVPSPREED